MRNNEKRVGVHNTDTLEKAKREMMKFEKNKKEKSEIPVLLRTERCASGVRFGVKK